MSERISIAELRKHGLDFMDESEVVLALVEAVEAARWLVAPGVVYEVRCRKALDGPLLDLAAEVRAALDKFDFGAGGA